MEQRAKTKPQALAQRFRSIHALNLFLPFLQSCNLRSGRCEVILLVVLNYHSQTTVHIHLAWTTMSYIAFKSH